MRLLTLILRCQFLVKHGTDRTGLVVRLYLDYRLARKMHRELVDKQSISYFRRM